MFSLFLLAFAGIPLTSGFVSKFAVFKAAGEGGAIPLVIVGVIASAVAAYFYVRVIVLMFFTDPPDDAPVVVVPSVLTTAVVTITAAITFALGALPQPVLDLTNISNQFLRCPVPPKPTNGRETSRRSRHYVDLERGRS